MEYFQELERETERLYEIARRARSKGLDVSTSPEIPLAKDLAERVEGLVGPEGIAERIKELENDKSREEVAFQIAAEIASQPVADDDIGERERLADQAIRTALAILTEGVVAAPLEGIARVRIKENFDRTRYLAVYFAGPIRSAGGTAAALSVLVADYIRLAIKLDRYKPIEREIERYVEEVELYESEVTNLQYSPKPDEVRLAAGHIPVEVTGEPTDKVEVSHRDLERVETNNIRGGALLAMVEGVIQKAPKVLKYAKQLKLEGWDWLEKFSKAPRKDESEDKVVVKADSKYIEDIIGGRPVLAYPSEKGAFRLRYGRSRNTGLAAMGVHPATMELLQFLAVGTQMKIERPGKGNCVVPVDTIDGPIVKLKNGDVLRVEDTETARKIRSDVQEILFLGDMLVAFGEFLRNNHVLMPAGWCEEWWIQTIMSSETYPDDDPLNLSYYSHNWMEFIPDAPEAFRISREYDVPLHPRYTYFYHDVTVEELNILREWLKTAELGDELALSLGPEKRILEVLGVPHRQKGSRVIIGYDDAYALINTLAGPLEKSDDSVDAINRVSPVRIMKKAPTYIGSRVGRPEKTKERKMRPAPHVLFPIGKYGGSRRNIPDAAKKGSITVEIGRATCPSCRVSSMQSKCPNCGSRTVIGEPGKRTINLAALLKRASENVSVRKLDEVKGVEGMISSDKFPEPLEKGILRAKNEVYTFKDATIRHDSTDLPLTHFTPAEVGVDVERLRELGYTEDCYGRELESSDQILELKVQDVVISENCADYLVRVANFVDDLLERFYGLERFYNVKRRDDLVGHLIAGLAPHTSAAVLGRIIGFTEASACYAHPYFHSAKRRNCDSDEDSVMLLLDALLNFSKSYLPSTRGGSMDAPLVLSTRIDPEEIDDESHNIDTMDMIPLDVYERSFEHAKPTEVLDKIDNVEKRLGTPEQYQGLMFSHNTSSIHAGPRVCLYKLIPSMKEKVESQITLAEMIRAVDQKGVVEGVLMSHFLPDMMGNIRAFSRQKVRCTRCNKKYRRIPLIGECKCGGNLVLTVSKGSVIKYLEISKDLASRYPIDSYLMQRIEILEYGVNSLFESDRSRQSSLDVFL
ncbi:DNA polymerase II large subunit [Methanothermobacter wolfeii]|uniref:DNA polymerase II large subunit n=1 Tax=Methanothermobacter wolfeii TaxID=145261 RepID=UPI0024B3A03B|nr:DNA polymerase II large subunit [Methanothermobacter wolfeii]MDI6701834.1 DNA polymerase II large subunit [Methanothermobacter wolfeii]MDI6841279.1 DNA polymerase II large subunit [Methanothermobacter wolfeii]